MKKILLILTLIFTGISYSQVVLNVNSPLNIGGSYDFEYAKPVDGWGNADLTIQGNFVQGDLMFVEDGSPGLNAQGNPISQEGCNALINDLTGKIAVVFRNTCEFSTKALNAQNAGAIGVIIINREDAVLTPAAGTFGASVTIPVAIVSSALFLMI